MTSHLRPDELVDAVEQELEAARRDHLDACAACRDAVSDLRATLDAARTVDQPEPSPLFWDHFSARVREATSSAVLPAEPWWHGWLKPVGVLTAALGAITLVFALRPGGSVAPTETAGETAAFVPMADDGSWNLVIGLAADIDVSDVREVAKPAEGTADAMIAELSAAQRRALVQLLKEDIGDH